MTDDTRNGRVFQQNTRFDNGFQLALKYLGYRARSRKEVRSYLKKKGVAPHLIRQIMEKLEYYRYVDDLAYARSYVSSRKKRSPRSVFALRYELSGRGISDTMIDQVLGEEDDASLAVLALEQRRRQWAQLDASGFTGKALVFLKNRGFSYEISAGAVDRFILMNSGLFLKSDKEDE